MNPIKGKPHVTIKDIARIAGVSHPTVSKALNNQPGVNKVTRKKILSIAQEMNYTPNLAAKRLADRKTNSIGLIWPLQDLFFYNLCIAIQREASKRGFRVIVSLADEVEAIQSFNEHFVDSIVSWGSPPPHWTPSYEFISEKRKFPGKMLVMGGGKVEEAHSIAIDRQLGIFKAVEHLKQLGHRRITFFGNSPDKLAGFTKAIIELQLDYHPDYVVRLDDPSNLAEQHVLEILRKEKTDRSTAFIADNHGTLFQLVNILRKHAMRIPDDFSLIAYDDIPEMEQLLGISITTVGPGIEQLAATALDIIAEEMHPPDGQQWVNTMIQPKLTVRDSTKALQI